jgi:hypothetical protein
MRRRSLAGIAVLAVALSSLLLAYWFDPNRVIWTRDGTVATVHQYTDSKNVTNWNVLVFIYQRNSMGYLADTGYISLNGPGTEGHGNYCWNDGNRNCLNVPLGFSLNQTLTIDALNDGNFMIRNRQP